MSYPGRKGHEILSEGNFNVSLAGADYAPVFDLMTLTIFDKYKYEIDRLTSGFTQRMMDAARQNFALLLINKDGLV